MHHPTGRDPIFNSLADIRVVIGPVIKSAALTSGPIDSQGQERRREVSPTRAETLARFFSWRLAEVVAMGDV